MARRTTTAIVRATPSIPTIRIAAPRAAPMVRRKGRTRSRRKGVASGGVTPLKAGITAAIIGFAEKSGVLDKIPEVPVVGRKGALAIIAYYWAGHGGGTMARDIALVAAAVSGYELGLKGSISGF